MKTIGPKKSVTFRGIMLGEEPGPARKETFLFQERNLQLYRDNDRSVVAGTTP